MGGQRSRHARGEIGIVALERRDVDRHPRHVASGKGPAGLLEHPIAQSFDKATLLGEPHENIGRHHAPYGVLPARQRLDAEHGAIPVKDRLVDEAHIGLVRQSRPKIFLEAPALAHILVHVPLIEPDASPPVGLCFVQRGVGIAHQLVGGEIGAPERRPDAQAGRKVMALDFDRARRGLGQRRREPLGIPVATRLELDHPELVAPEPGHGVDAAHCAGHAVADHPNELVAHRMAQEVVYALEVIEIHIMEGKPHTGLPRGNDRPLQPVLEQCPVGQAGQRIMEREMARMRLALDQPLGCGSQNAQQPGQNGGAHEQQCDKGRQRTGDEP